jgi:hypothetical protein
LSRLDSFIRRLMAQRACLDMAASAIASVPGLVVELGLGNGRTYDHLREKLPDRRILVFERAPNPHALSTPPAQDLVPGPITETLLPALGAHAGSIALVHNDTGTGAPEIDRPLAQFVGRHLPRHLAPGGLIVSDQPLAAAGLDRLDPPSGVARDRYFIYRQQNGRVIVTNDTAPPTRKPMFPP